MCGRFTLTTPDQQLASLFHDAPLPESLLPRYNIAPTQPVVVYRWTHAEPELSRLRWGLIPSWAEDAKIANRLINARSETAAEKPSFRAAFRKRRCLIPADGFYEWKQQANVKQPYHIRFPDQGPFAFAGLWESWQDPEGNPVETCTILTTTANQELASVHPRMPVILAKEVYDDWVDPTLCEVPRILQLLEAMRNADLVLQPVGLAVNDARFDDKECIQPLRTNTTTLASPKTRKTTPRPDQPGLWD